MEKIKVVIADDHALVREGTRTLLEREPDIEVIGEASDGVEAVRIISDLKPDVAIIDIAMPKLSGIEVTKQVKSQIKSIAILILTAYDNDEYIFALLEAGAAGYLLKDVHGRNVIEAVRSVYSGESVLHPSVAHKVIQRATASRVKTEEQELYDELSDREKEVLKLAAKGLSNREISEDLSISIRTVQGHINNLFHKLRVGSRTEAIFLCAKKGWFSFEDLS